MRGDVVPPNTAPVCLGARVSSGCARAPGPEARLKALTSSDGAL